jgi:AcrR family transcriptional regulator
MNRTAEKNRRKIEKALLKIMKTTPFEEISVLRVCKEADISRTAFYHHFASLDDVLLSAYEAAHEKAFGKREWTAAYFRSDQFLRDMISFFDHNSELITVLRHWDLLSRVASFPTQKSLLSASEENDEILSSYPEYTMVYFWIRPFTICNMWLRGGKKETPEELFEIIRHMNEL